MSVEMEDVEAGDEPTIEEIEAMLGPLAAGREAHVHADAVVVRPDNLEAALEILKHEAGFDHLSCLVAQEYEDQFESIYYLKQYADPTRELGVVVPTSRDAPISQSAAAVYPTADWHEREAYDLVGIQYEGHPDLRRILLPETWQGHPLSLEYDQDRPQIVQFAEHANPLEGHERQGDTLFLNIGPHHPATHGVLHLKTVLDGEQVIDVEPDLGYLHRCEEQCCQNGTYRHQIMPYPDRWDYSSAGILNEWAYARTAEALADIEVPPYADVLRTMSAELCRMCAHFLALGTFCLDIFGDFTAVFMYSFRDRERIQKILEELTGQRKMFNYMRLGGVVWDIPEPRDQFFELVRDFLDELPAAIDEYHDLITTNEVFQVRTINTGILEPEDAKAFGCTGPVARGSGIDYDLRRDDPYGYYPELEWDVITQDGCDNYSRLLVRMLEVEQSARIVEQCIELLESWPEDERELQARVPRTLKPEPDAEVYRAVEAAKGELGIYIRSDGTDSPARFKIRSPCYHNLSSLATIAEGAYVADLIASLGSLDIILGEVDR